MRARSTPTAALGVALALAVAGCGGGDEEAGGGSSGDAPALTIQVVSAPSPNGPEAAQIRRAFAALATAKLDAANRRDRTDVCEQLECIARVVSDQVSITAWPDREAAAGQAAHHVGRLGVTFSTSLVPRGERGAYLRVIREAAAGGG